MKIDLLIIAILLITLNSCGGRRQGSDQQEQRNNEISAEQPKSVTATAHPGKKVYDSVCLVCHMADGTGVPGMYPPLINTEWVIGEKQRLIQITLQGLSGKIEVNGITYNNVMPPNSYLSDREIADVLTYVRQSFGNDASEITIEEVQDVRNSL